MWLGQTPVRASKATPGARTQPAATDVEKAMIYTRDILSVHAHAGIAPPKDLEQAGSFADRAMSVLDGVIDMLPQLGDIELRNACIVGLVGLMGLRPAQVRDLRVSDIDGYFINVPKLQKCRHHGQTLIHRHLYHVLREHALRVGQDELLFSNKGRKVSARLVNRAWCEATKTPLHVDRVVYFAKVGGFVKIGTTRNIKRRLGEIAINCPESPELLWVEPGSFGRESELHARFSKSRKAGEWFHFSSDIEAYIDGQPKQLSLLGVVP